MLFLFAARDCGKGARHPKSQSNSVGRSTMALQLGDTAPDFEADTTEGRIRFHEWLGNSWGVLFSHPKDFTPVCTTELGYMARIKPEFDKRGVKIIGLSVDPVDLHEKWARRHQGDARRGAELPDDRRSRPHDLQALRHAAGERAGHVRRPHARRQSDRAQRVRHRPRQEDQADPGLSDDHGAQFRRGAARDRLAAAHRQASRGDAGELEGGRAR